MKCNKVSLIFIFLCIISQASALYLEDNQTIINMDHAVRIQKLNSNPAIIAPGENVTISLEVKNSAQLVLDDLRITLILPSTFKFLNDVNRVKISRLESGESKNIGFSAIASPTASEGIYDASLIIEYVSYLGTDYSNVGKEKRDNYTFGLTVKAVPEIFAQIESAGVYQGKDVGVVTIKFVNQGVGNVQFLTAELLDSEDYEVITSNKEYIGDLDSDDFESVDFRIKLNEEKKVDLLLKAYYKDSLNKNYAQEFKLPLEMRTAKELGISTNGTASTIGIILLLAVIAYFVYKKYRPKKKLIVK